MSKPIKLTWEEEQLIRRLRAEEAAKSPATRLAQEIAGLARSGFVVGETSAVIALSERPSMCEVLGGNL